MLALKWTVFRLLIVMNELCRRIMLSMNSAIAMSVMRMALLTENIHGVVGILRIDDRGSQDSRTRPDHLQNLNSLRRPLNVE